MATAERDRTGCLLLTAMCAAAIVTIVVTISLLQGSPPPLTPEQSNIAAAKAAIRYVAKDADSVVFRAVEAKPNSAVCGEYNGRNSFGALAGFKRFIWKTGNDLLVEDGKDPFEHAWNRICLGIDY